MATALIRNLLDPLPEPRPDGSECFDDLVRRPGVRLERIVSHGQATAEGYWYDQEEDEWIMVVDGKAILALQNPDEVVTLQSGDHLVISAHRKHRVESTTSPTVWLALWLCPE